MYNNITSYKRKKARLYNANLRKRRLISMITLLSLLFLLLTFSTYKIYRKIRCKDLQYAVEYKLTSGDSSNRLLRVQQITLKYNDNRTVIVEVSGLAKETPHKRTTIRGTFQKDQFNSWELIKAEEA